MKGVLLSPQIYINTVLVLHFSPHHPHSQRQNLLSNQNFQLFLAHHLTSLDPSRTELQPSSKMQFKSILAVLALAVVVIATPIEPAAVNLNPATLVKRTTPQEVCSTTNQVASVCTAGGKTLTPSAALITIVLSILGILNDLQCLGRSLTHTLAFFALLTRPQLRITTLMSPPAIPSYAVINRVTRM